MGRQRRERGDNRSVLGGFQEQASSSPAPEDFSTASTLANQAYESAVASDFDMGTSQRIRIRQIPLQEIMPDPMQARRAIPSMLRQYWNGKPAGSAFLFENWIKEINLERKQNGQSQLDVLAYLQGATTDRAPATINESSLEQISPKALLESALMPIITLAASIRRDGLTNPITVAALPPSAAQDVKFIIETGERRWLAFQLLHLFEGRQWLDIPARVVDKIDFWRQATENTARADLNAIGRSRQFAILLMDLLNRESGQRFSPLTDFEAEQDFYAQVADGEEWRIPRGKGEQLLNAMGLRNSTQLRHLRRLLRLPNPVWQIADDLNWSENFIQKNLLSSAGDNEKQLLAIALKLARAESYTVSALTVGEDFQPVLDNPKTAQNPLETYFAGKAQARLKRLLKVPARLDQLDESERLRVRHDADKLINDLEHLLSALDSN
ncbi:hypothetical protein MASR2M15_28720 [Anaerolineales bacterium]